MPVEIIEARLAAVRLQVIDQEVALMKLKEDHEYDIKYCDVPEYSCEYESERLVEEKKLLALESAAKELVLVLSLIS
jgi:hypothetical protein